MPHGVHVDLRVGEGRGTVRNGSVLRAGHCPPLPRRAGRTREAQGCGPAGGEAEKGCPQDREPLAQGRGGTDMLPAWVERRGPGQKGADPSWGLGPARCGSPCWSSRRHQHWARPSKVTNHRLRTYCAPGAGLWSRLCLAQSWADRAAWKGQECSGARTEAGRRV